MSRTFLSVSLAAIALVGAAFLVAALRSESGATPTLENLRSNELSTPASRAESVAADSGAKGTQAARPAHAPAEPRSASGTKPIMRSFLPESAFEGSRKADLALLAKSPEEHAWLRQHGYPSLEEWRSRASIPDNELADRAAGGDLVAEVMQAERRGQSGDLQGALAQLDAALVRGSVFAPLVGAQLLNARVQAKQSSRPPSLQGSPRGGDAPILAQLQLALMLGDHQAPQFLRAMELPAIRSADVTAAMQSAATSLVALNERRVRMGLPPLVVTPRPGADHWLPGSDPPGVISYWRPDG